VGPVAGLASRASATPARGRNPRSRRGRHALQLATELVLDELGWARPAARAIDDSPSCH